MTIREYLNGVPDMKADDGTSLRDTVQDLCSVWSNAACRGYAIAAMQAAGMSREQIECVVQSMRGIFDDVTIEEAEKIYQNY